MKPIPKKYSNATLLVLAAAMVLHLAVSNLDVFTNILLVLLGFGAVILIHEFGHFIAAKLGDIKVDAFSIGFPPTLLGVRKYKRGFGVRFLPGTGGRPDAGADRRKGVEPDFKVAVKGEPHETEYRLGVIPLGGFVKMLGQDDTGAVEACDDPRSFANKSFLTRLAVISAGVVFNALSAALVFMLVFLMGIKLPPPIIGDVMKGSPADRAGLSGGDEIVAIEGNNGSLDFTNIVVTAALSDVNEPVRMTVRHPDGSLENVSIVAEMLPGSRTRAFGIAAPRQLQIAQVDDPARLLERTGLLPGDRVRAVDGRPIEGVWELEEVVRDSYTPRLPVLVERVGGDSNTPSLVEGRLCLDLVDPMLDPQSESEIGHVYSMVPRLRVAGVAKTGLSVSERFRSLLARIGVVEEADRVENGLLKGDIFVKAGDVPNPTYWELRSLTEQSRDEELKVVVLRRGDGGVERTVATTVVPKWSSSHNKVIIGIDLTLDAEHPVVAKTIPAGGREPLEIPRGATVTAVGGVEVSNYYQIIDQIKRHSPGGVRLGINWRLGDARGNVVVDSSKFNERVTIEPSLADLIPFEDMTKLYKADGPVNAVVMGWRKTVMLITRTYLTLKQVIGGLVSPRELVGPVGIVSISYRIVAEYPLVNYMYFMGLISACIAVFNFLPLPPLDGGLVVILAVEKIKGSALSRRAQGIVAYAGWVVIGSLFLYVTFNDIVNNIFR